VFSYFVLFFVRYSCYSGLLFVLVLCSSCWSSSFLNLVLCFWLEFDLYCSSCFCTGCLLNFSTCYCSLFLEDFLSAWIHCLFLMLLLVFVLCSVLKLLLSCLSFGFVVLSLWLFLFSWSCSLFIILGCFGVLFVLPFLFVNCFLIGIVLGVGLLFDPYEWYCSLFLDDFLCAWIHSLCLMLFLVVVLRSALKLLVSFVLWVCWFELVLFLCSWFCSLFKSIFWSFVLIVLFLILFLGLGVLFDPYECDCAVVLDDFLSAW